MTEYLQELKSKEVRTNIESALLRLFYKSEVDDVKSIKLAYDAANDLRTLEARIKELEAALEKAEVVVTHHHEIGHIIHAYENMREDCDVCKKFDYKVFRLVTK